MSKLFLGVIYGVVIFLLAFVATDWLLMPSVTAQHPTVPLTPTPLPTIVPITLPVATTTSAQILITPTISATPSPTKKVVPTILVSSPLRSSDGRVRIMPLGDSITHGDMVPGGYRTHLWNLLRGDDDKIDFVGLLSSGPVADSDHEGHIGWTISQLNGSVASWIRANPPDIILLHIGTNDLLAQASAASMTQSLSQLIGTIFATKPDTYVVVAGIIPSARDADSEWLAYNASIPGVVAQYRAQGRKIVSVDMSNAVIEGDLVDGLHPNISGYNKMASLWYPVVSTIYREVAATF